MNARVGILIGFALLVLAIIAAASATALGRTDWVGPLFITSAVLAVLGLLVGVCFWKELLAKVVVAFSAGVLLYFFVVLMWTSHS